MHVKARQQARPWRLCGLLGGFHGRRLHVPFSFAGRLCGHGCVCFALLPPRLCIGDILLYPGLYACTGSVQGMTSSDRTFSAKGEHHRYTTNFSTLWCRERLCVAAGSSGSRACTWCMHRRSCSLLACLSTSSMTPTVQQISRHAAHTGWSWCMCTACQHCTIFTPMLMMLEADSVLLLHLYGTCQCLGVNAQVRSNKGCMCLIDKEAMSRQTELAQWSQGGGALVFLAPGRSPQPASLTPAGQSAWPHAGSRPDRAGWSRLPSHPASRSSMVHISKGAVPTVVGDLYRPSTAQLPMYEHEDLHAKRRNVCLPLMRPLQSE